MLVCFDLDGTISAYPEQMCALMAGLRAAGHEVHVLSGTPHESVSPAVITSKENLLAQCGCSTCYDMLAVVANPSNDVADAKVDYMKRVGAAALVDNKKANVKAARKAGFMALHVRPPKQ